MFEANEKLARDSVMAACLRFGVAFESNQFLISLARTRYAREPIVPEVS